MKKTTLLTIIISLFSCALHAQGLKLTFTSVTDAKFFVYLNGKLQNEKSSGMVTINNLEDKDYHIRIVIDDPYEVTVTRTIRPDRKNSEYTVRFNAVRERVYLKPAGNSSREDGDNNLWIPQDPTPPQQAQSEEPTRSRTTIRRNESEDTATDQILKKVRTQNISN